MDDLQFIIGLMKQNTNALGFIPAPQLAQRYIPKGQYIVQRDLAGRSVGYLLHGALNPGRTLYISQHCIEIDRRQQGHGMDALAILLGRAKLNNCRSIVLKCAENLPSNQFWKAAGFECTAIKAAINSRNRRINVYTLDLWRTLFTSR